MIKQTFAEKMAQAKADRKRNIKLSIKTTPASKVHVRCQPSQYVQPLTPTQIKIQENEKRIAEIRKYLAEQYKQYQPAPRQWPEFTPEIIAERKKLDAEDVALLRETHYLRNPQRTPEMDKGSDHPVGGHYRHSDHPSPVIKSNEAGAPEFDDRPNTFGEFDAEWD